MNMLYAIILFKSVQLVTSIFSFLQHILSLLVLSLTSEEARPRVSVHVH